ncbi:MAG: hypothetical protein U0903_06020 [Planctomycetales bacterium]
MRSAVSPRWFLITGVLSLFVSVQGCAVMKAANQPGKYNLAVMTPGVSRPEVVAELGKPVSSDTLPDGRIQDVYAFRQGYSKPVRIGRVLFHGAADLATGFLWELAGTPIEMIANGTPVKAVITYDESRNVAAVQVLEGQQAFHEYGPGTSIVSRGGAWREKRTAGRGPTAAGSLPPLDPEPGGGEISPAGGFTPQVNPSPPLGVTP